MRALIPARGDYKIMVPMAVGCEVHVCQLLLQVHCSNGCPFRRHAESTANPLLEQVLCISVLMRLRLDADVPLAGTLASLSALHCRVHFDSM